MPPEFELPKIHTFPPLYTKQPNLTVLQKQLDTWGEIILKYCEHYKITSLSLQGSVLGTQLDNLDTLALPLLFVNKNINRQVSDDFRGIIFKHLIHKLHRAEYINPKQPDAGILVYWRTPTEWANIIYSYVERSGQLGTVLTLYELTKLEDATIPNDLRNLEYSLLVRVLAKMLVKQRRAQILTNEENNQIAGVKIV